MKRLLIVFLVFAITGGVWIGFGEKFGHLLEGGEHKDETHAQHSDSGRKDKHAHGADAKQTPHDGKNDEHSKEESSEVHLTAEQIELAGIKSTETIRGRINLSLVLAGEVRLDQNRVVQVVPRVPGVVRSVRSYLGDYVERDAVLAVLDSRELADAKSTYVAANEKTKLALSTFRREERLWKRRISSEQEYLNSKSVLSEARIAERAASQQLKALGTSTDVLKRLANGPAASLTNYEVVAPLAGTIIEKHITNGASVDQKEPIFRIADLQNVWVIASVYEKDIARVKKGQSASVSTKAHGDSVFEGKITWVADTMDERTRTLKVRIEVDNSKRLLKPGMFVRANVVIDAKEDVISVPAAAVRRQGGEVIVFVDEGGGRFERREVKIGTQADGRVEILKGLRTGELVVAEGSFILKSEQEKEGFGGGHGH